MDLNKPLIVVTGGGLGARSINNGIAAIAKQLIKHGFSIYHVTGKKHFKEIKQSAFEHPDYHIVEFVYKDMAVVLGAADIVVSRGSATFLQELAALAKPVIIVPAAVLGDQLKNAEVYKKSDSAYVIDDKKIADGQELLETLLAWKADPEAAQSMTKRFHEFARPNAAVDVAKLILLAGTKQQ